uniref:Uncharacterized protein n=1 Tax=Vitis vinifera TaxID=29760 RepID=F6HWP2_VITVI
MPPPTWVNRWQPCGLPPPTWLHGEPYIRACNSFCTILDATTWVRERILRFEE